MKPELKSRFILFLLLSFIPLFCKGDKLPGDYVDAMAFCDQADLRRIEGLWSYPEDDTTVLIYRDKDKKGIYGITVIESADCSLSPGMKLGELHESTDPDKFNLKIFTNVKNGILTTPKDAVATFSESKESLSIKVNSPFKLRINPTRLLPSFWRLVSVSLKTKESAPEGMIKVYPSYDGNNSSRRAPRYL